MLLIGRKAQGLLDLENQGFRVPEWKLLPADSDDISSLQADLESSNWGKELLIVRSSPNINDSGDILSTRRLNYVIGVRSTNLPQVVSDLRSTFRLQAASPLIIQRLIKAEVSGRTCTLGPGQVLTKALYGLGEGLNLAALEPDHFRVTGNRVESLVSLKNNQIQSMPRGGISRRKVASSRAKSPCLTKKQILTIASKAGALRRLLGKDLEFEWCLSKGELFFVQCQDLDPDLGIWQSDLIQGEFLGTTTPLSFSFARHIFQKSCQRASKKLGTDLPEQAKPLGYHKGRIHYRLGDCVQILRELPFEGMSLQNLSKKLGIPLTLTEEAERKPLTRLKVAFNLAKHWLFTNCFKRDRIESDTPNLEKYTLESFLSWEDKSLRAWDSALLNDFFALHFEGWLFRFVRRALPGEPLAHLEELFAGQGPGILREQARHLDSLVEHLRTNDALMRQFQGWVGDDLWDRLRAPEFQVFRECAADFLEKYDRCLSPYHLETPSIGDRPNVLMSMVWARASVPKETSEEAARQVRRRAEFRLLSRLRSWKKLVFRLLLKQTRARLNDRDNYALEKQRFCSAARWHFLQLGRELHLQDRIADQEDVFHLTREEILREVRGEFVTDDLKRLVSIRRQEYLQNAETPIPSQTRPITGLPCSPGVAEAPIKYWGSSQNETEGRIVVTEQLGSDWSQLRGARGLLLHRHNRHSTTAARQLGIPCVVTTTDLRGHLKEGQLVHLDGSRGVVKPLRTSAERPPKSRPAVYPGPQV